MNKTNPLSTAPFGTVLRPRTFDHTVDDSKQGYVDRIAANFKEVLASLSGQKDQICFTVLTDRGVEVISTGITEEMLKQFMQGTSSIHENLLVKNFIKSALGEDLFNRLSEKNLMIVSKLLLQPGDNIEYLKTILTSANADAKLNLLEKYPNLVKLDSKHFDKLLSLNDLQLKFLVENPQLLENLKAETLEKVLSLESWEVILNDLKEFRHPELLSKLEPQFFEQQALIKDPSKILSILEHSPHLLENMRPETLTKILSLDSCESILESLSDFSHADLLMKLEPSYFDQKSLQVMPEKILSFLDGNPEFLRKLDEGTLNRIFSLDNPDDALYSLSYSPELIQNSEQLNKILNEPNPVQHLQWLFSVKLG